MVLSILSAAALMLAGQPVPQPSQDAGAQAVPAKGKNSDPNRKICKRSSTGTMFVKVTCRTAAEWAMEREATERARDQLAD